MPQVRSEVWIQAPVDQVYGLAKDIEGLAAYIDSVESVKILERDGPNVVSEWVGIIKEFRRQVKWTERDHWDDEAHVCTFHQLKGEFQQYEGTWSFQPEGEGTRVELVVDYVYEAPLIGPLIRKVVQRIMQNSCDAILAGLKERAEGGTQ